jgi:hypothetical protein
MDLAVNSLIERTEVPSEGCIDRVLWINQSGAEAVTIDIRNPKAWPIRHRIPDLVSAIGRDELRILTVDPYGCLVQPEDQIKATHREHREKSWSIIAPLIDSGDPRIFNYRSIDSPVHARAREKGKRKGTVYELLRRYWQRGQTKNALLPLFFNCGWRNEIDKKGQKKVRRRLDGKVAQKKVGRRTRLRADGESVGVNVDESVLEKMRRGMKHHYHKRDKKSLKKAYKLMLADSFRSGYTLGRAGNLVPVLLPPSEYPTYEQFKYWFWRDRRPKESQIARSGEGRFNLEGRALLGNPAELAFGPGSMFEIDATVADCYLVSSLDRTWIIGRPVVYFLVDRFSHLVAGFSVALEGPSWLGAMLALENAGSDKVAFCAEFGISIRDEEWPSHHLPEALLADRGEIEGVNGDHLANAFNMRIHNTAPGRADLKGIVEQHFDLTNERVIRWSPGAVRKRERGDRDYRLDARLDLQQFRRIILLSVLDYNKNHRMNGYHLDEYMIADGVDPYPLDLWHWGIKNRTGHLRTVPKERLRLNLLPEFDASVTLSGILCEGLYYTCDLAVREQWFERTGETGREPIRVARDPRNLSQIYLRLDNGARMEVCHLKDSDHAFDGRDAYEAADEFELRKLRTDLSRGPSLQAAVELQADFQAVVDEAERMTPEGLEKLSKRSRVAGIRENRKNERDHERQANFWQLGEDPALNAEVAVETNSSSSRYVPPAQSIQSLRESIQRRTQP